jgi:hypothetical protein
MLKIIGATFLIVLLGTSVVAWSRAKGPHELPYAHQVRAFSPDQMHKTWALRSLPSQKINDMSFVFSESD